MHNLSRVDNFFQQRCARTSTAPRTGRTSLWSSEVPGLSKMSGSMADGRLPIRRSAAHHTRLMRTHEHRHRGAAGSGTGRTSPLVVRGRQFTHEHQELSGRERKTRHQRFRCVVCVCGSGVIMDQLEKTRRGAWLLGWTNSGEGPGAVWIALLSILKNRWPRLEKERVGTLPTCTGSLHS